MNDRCRSKLATRTTQSLLTELGLCFSGTFGFLFLLGMGGAFQVADSLLGTLCTAGSLLFVLSFSLRFLRVLREVKRRDEQGNSNHTSEDIVAKRAESSR